MNTLLIHKIGTSFWHRHNGLPATDLNVSNFVFVIYGNICYLLLIDGSTNFKYEVSDVTIKVDSGSVESSFSPISLRTRLEQLNYTPYINASGLTDNQLLAIQGANAPSNTNVFATMADVGGGSLSFNKIFYWDGNPFTVPASFSGTLWNITRNAPVTYALSGTTLTPTSGEATASETLLATSN